MKAKYYMRGIGLGMMFLAGSMLAAGIPSKEKDLSKEEILEAAKQYGLELTEDGTDNSDQGLNLEGIIGPSEKEQEESKLPGENETKAEDIQGEPENSQEEPEGSQGESENSQEEPEGSQSELETSQEESERSEAGLGENQQQAENDSLKQDNSEAGSAREYAMVEVKDGMVGAAFAKVAYQAGLVSDEEEFTVYMNDNLYAKKIRSGVYQIEMGSTYKEICEIITKGR